METKENGGKEDWKEKEKEKGEWALAAVDKLQSDPAHPFVTMDACLELFFFNLVEMRKKKKKKTK